MRKFIPFVFLLFSIQTLLGQQTFTLSGKVRDGNSGESLAGASIYLASTKVGTLSAENGAYSLVIPANDSVEVTFSFTGYETVVEKLKISKNTRLDIELLEKGVTVGDVVIEGSTLEEKLNSTQMSSDKLTIMEAKKIPALFGEVDIIKTLQLKPGVQSGGEGMSGLYVRGGGPDQNLFLLDNAPVYNPSHLFGLFSTFNGDAVKDVTLYKGGYPAQFAGKLSSVIDIGQREGSMKKLTVTGGLGLISSRLAIEVPLVKEKVSLLLAGRRTYFDVFTRQLNELKKNKPNYNPIPDYYFYDFNGKLSIKATPRDQVYVNFYFGRDKFRFKSGDFDFKLGWGNRAGSVIWDHAFNSKLILKTTGTYSDYNYSFDNTFSQFSFKLTSGIRDFAGQTQLIAKLGDRHNFKAGLAYTYHSFAVGRFNASSTDGTVNFKSGQDFFGTEMGAYVNDEITVNPKLSLNGGLRLSGFVGSKQFYKGLEPRASLKYSLSPNISLKAAYARMFQYVHMVSTSGASLPTDMWYPSGKVVQPQRSDQVAAGASFLLGKNFLVSDEAYYKWMHRQIDLRDGAQIFFNPDLDKEFVFGKGWGYGNEIYFEKKRGTGNSLFDRLNGWVGYTLSWSWRQFDDINNGLKFHPRYDRRHDISVVLIEELGKRWSVSGTWVFGTGNAVTLPIAWMLSIDPVPGTNVQVIPIYTSRNSFRMPPYHRMDLGLVYDLRPKWGESDLTFSVYNVYSRRNPYFIYFDIRTDNLPGTGTPSLTGLKVKQVSLFPIIPSLTWNFKF